MRPTFTQVLQIQFFRLELILRGSQLDHMCLVLDPQAVVFLKFQFFPISYLSIEREIVERKRERRG